jgi:hypothetical protein
MLSHLIIRLRKSAGLEKLKCFIPRPVRQAGWRTGSSRDAGAAPED